MHALRFALIALLCASAAHARPLTVEEVARLTPPHPSWEFFGRFGVAIDGDFALVSGERHIESVDTVRHAAALLYQRAGNTWSYVGTLGPIAPLAEGIRPGLAMRDGIAMIITDRPRVFERIGTTWTEAAIDAGLAGRLEGEDIEIDSGRMLVPVIGCARESAILNRSGDTWRVQSYLTGVFPENCASPAHVHDLHDHRVAAVLRNVGEPPHLRIYYGEYGWAGDSAGALSNAAGLAPDVAQNGYFTIATDSRRFGTRVQYQDTYGIAPFVSPYGLQPADGHMQRDRWSASSLTRLGAMFAQRNWRHDDQAYVINVFALNNDNARTFEHVAMLRARQGSSLGARNDASGNRIIASGFDGQLGENVVRIFELPDDLTPYATQSHNFEEFAPRIWWQPAAGSLFFVAQSGENRVYRQPSTNGTPSSWLPYSSRSDQGIQAEIILRTFSGTDRWVGLGTRRVDDSNYYYTALRTSGVVQLNRMLNGVSTTLCSAPARLAIGQKVRLRLESIGTQHRVYLDDRLLCSVSDDALSGGLAGVIMHRAAADYDNVLIGRSPFTMIYADDFFRGGPHEWRYEGSGWRRFGVMRQSSSEGYARLNVGARTSDQIVQVRVRPLSFVNPDNWVGVLLRYKDARNHSYLSLRGRGVISLWRREHGVITQLATRAIPVTTGAWYTLRVEVVLGRAQVYVNDVWQFTSGELLGPNDFDTADMKGGVGLITYKATAEFDDFLAYQP